MSGNTVSQDQYDQRRDGGSVWDSAMAQASRCTLTQRTGQEEQQDMKATGSRYKFQLTKCGDAEAWTRQDENAG